MSCEVSPFGTGYRSFGHFWVMQDFEKLPNANKRHFIAKYPIEDLFLAVIDTAFRNGIGHHSAHYEAETDEIVLYDTKRFRNGKEHYATHRVL